MKAIVIDPDAASADRIRVGVVGEPDPRSQDVLVDVMAVALTSWERDAVTKKRGRSLKRMASAHPVPLGLEFAGIVARSAHGFSAGDRVIGSPHLLKESKALAERVAVPADRLVALDDNIEFTDAAALPVSAVTARRAVDTLALTGPDHRVLVVGASGGVGVFATAIAAGRGADVVGIGSPAWVDQAASFGVNEAYSYRDMSVSSLAKPFDLIFDLTGRQRFTKIRSLLGLGGAYVTATPQHDAFGFVAARFSSRRNKLLWVPYGPAEDVEAVLRLRREGSLPTGVPWVRPIAEYRDAFATIAGGSVVGRPVLDTSDWSAV